MSIDTTKPIGAQIAARFEASQTVNTLVATMNFALLSDALAGDGLQQLIDNGDAELAYALPKGGREEAQLITALADALHERLRRGERLGKALNQLRVDGWYDRIQKLRAGEA